jgi:hypothetical protein
MPNPAMLTARPLTPILSRGGVGASAGPGLVVGKRWGDAGR